jgi:endonuclease VIII
VAGGRDRASLSRLCQRGLKRPSELTGQNRIVAEGDTIARAARRIGGALAGQGVRVSAPNPQGRLAGVERLDGRRLEQVTARGKNLLLQFGDLTLHSHVGMSGSWHLYPNGARWKRRRGAAWAVISGREADAVQFGGPRLRLLPTRSLDRDPILARLGPDILATDLDVGAVARSLRADPERSLGEALLDQREVAGIGNVFKSEACFAAKLDPRARIADLTDAELEDVVAAARDLMAAAVVERRAERAVYRRAGRPCVSCGTPIAVAGQGDANRSTYWCPQCQASERP